MFDDSENSLGEGAYGKVYKIIRKINQQVYAAKIIDIRGMKN